MALKDLPGSEVWAVSPEGKTSEFGLWVYLPETRENSHYPQVGISVIRRIEDGSWVPWMKAFEMRDPKKPPRYNPKVFFYMDSIPMLMRTLEELYKKHKAGSKAQDALPNMRKVLEAQKVEDQLDQDVRGFAEFK
jgi:hypothetical protein